MFTIQESSLINRPLSEVFAFVSNVENDVKYRQDIISAEWLSKSSTIVGSTFRHILNFMGKKEFKARISKYVINKSIEIEYISGSIQPTYRIEFERTNTGTKVIHHSEVRTYGLFRLLGPLMPLMGKSRIARDYNNLKKLLETNKDFDNNK